MVRTDRIGDVVLTLPMAGALKTAFPASRVTFLVREYTRPLVEGHPHIDDVMVLGERGGRPRLAENAQRIGAGGFDTALLVHPSFRLACILSLARIPTRIGTAYRWYSSLFSHRVRVHRQRGSRHEVEYNLELLRPLGIDPGSPVDFSLTPREEDRAATEMLWREWAPKPPVVVVHPGSGGSAVDLPVASMARLVQGLDSSGAEVLVTGSAEEVEVCRQVTRGTRARNLAGTFSLGELVALVARCDLLVANSTGPIHIAAGLGKPVVGFYSRAKACTPERWGPYTDRRLVFTPEADCSECTLSKCRRTRCMETIRPERVLESIRDLLRSG